MRNYSHAQCNYCHVQCAIIVMHSAVIVVHSAIIVMYSAVICVDTVMETHGPGLDGSADWLRFVWSESKSCHQTGSQAGSHQPAPSGLCASALKKRNPVFYLSLCICVATICLQCLWPVSFADWVCTGRRRQQRCEVHDRLSDDMRCSEPRQQNRPRASE